MTVFIIIALLALIGLVFRQTALRFRASLPAGADGIAPRFKIGAYVRWLAARIKDLASPSFFKKTRGVWNRWAKNYYPVWFKWVFLAFAAAFLYLAVSGLFFAIFIRRGMFGLPLLAHVMSGGLFAVGLAALLMTRAGAYRFDRRESVAEESFACFLFKNVPREFVLRVLFWMFALLGFIQVTTALFSMLPIITFNTQVALLMIHRWSALGLTLAAILFFDIALLDRAKTKMPPA